MKNTQLNVTDGLISTASVDPSGAMAVADFLARKIPTDCPIQDIGKWESVMNALYAITNDTFAIVLDTEDETG